MFSLTAVRARAMLPQRLDGRAFVALPVIIVVCYLVIVPLGILFWASLKTGAPWQAGALSFQNYAEAFSRAETYGLLSTSVIYAAGTTLVALILGGIFAWLVERTNAPFRNIAAALVYVPLIMPSMLFGIAWILILSPRVGILNVALVSLFGLSEGPLSVYSLGGMIWLEGLLHTPLTFTLLAPAFRAIDPSLEEAATVSGAGALDTIRRITLRLLFPAVGAAILMNFIIGLAGFEIPLLIGVPSRILVLTTKIYTALNLTPFDYAMASTLAVALVTVGSVGAFFYGFILRNSEKYVTVTGKGYRPKLLDLGRAKWLAGGFFFLYFLATVFAPAFVLLWSALLPYYSVPSLERLADVSLTNFAAAFDYPRVGLSVRNSLLLATAAATLTALLASLVSWVVIRLPGRGNKMLDTIASIPYAIPSVVIAVSIMWAYLTLPILPVYGTIWILLIAYVTKQISYVSRTTTSAMIQIDKELEEAAQTSGASWLQTMRRVAIPLLLPAIVSGWLFAFILGVREFSLAIMLSSTSSTVLPVVIFDIWTEGHLGLASALGILLLTSVTAAILLLRRLGGHLST